VSSEKGWMFQGLGALCWVVVGAHGAQDLVRVVVGADGHGG
jgi:hypothetical protein